MFGGGFGNNQPGQQPSLFGFATTTASQTPTTTTGLFGTPSQGASQPSAFSGFGTGTFQSSSTGTPFGFSGFGTQPAQPATTGLSFGFGTTPAITSSQAAPTSAFGGFGLPTSQPSQPQGFGGFGTQNQPASSTAAPSFGGFGLPQQPAQSSFGVPATTVASSAFSLGGFGQSQAPTTTASSLSSFGQTQPAGGAFSFGGFTSPSQPAAPQPTGNAFTFGPAPAAPAPSFTIGTPSFGGATQSQPATTTAAGSFSFFNTAAPTVSQSSSSFPSVVQPSTAAGSFGGAGFGAGASSFGFGTLNPVPAAVSAAPSFATSGFPSLSGSNVFGATTSAAAATTASTFPFLTEVHSRLGAAPVVPGFGFGAPTPPLNLIQPLSSSAVAPAFGTLPQTTTSVAPQTPVGSIGTFPTFPPLATPQTSAQSSFTIPSLAAVSTTTNTTQPFMPQTGSTVATSAVPSGAGSLGSFQFSPNAATTGWATPTVAAQPIPTIAAQPVPTVPAPSFGFSFGQSTSISQPAATTTVAPDFKLGAGVSQPVPQSTTAALITPTFGSVTHVPNVPNTTTPQSLFPQPAAPVTTSSGSPFPAVSTTINTQTATSQPSVSASPAKIDVPVPVITPALSATVIQPVVTVAENGISDVDKKFMEDLKKMTYEDFERYLDDTKRAVDQLEENWIQGTLKLNAYLSMRKDNTKAMRMLRAKIATIWEFEAKVERMLAAVRLSMNEIDETLTYLEKNATDPDEFFKKNVRKISAEDRYRANCYKTLDLLYREVRIALGEIDASRKKLLKNLIKEDEVRDLLNSHQMLSGQFEPKLLMENPQILGTIADMMMKEIKEIKNGQRQTLTKLRFQRDANAQSR